MGAVAYGEYSELWKLLSDHHMAGVHATLFFITFQLLWERPRSSWRDFGWLAYIVVLFSVSSVGNATQLRICELGFLEYRDHPGPPAGWEAGNTVVILSNAVYIFNTWLQDGLLVRRPSRPVA